MMFLAVAVIALAVEGGAWPLGPRHAFHGTHHRGLHAGHRLRMLQSPPVGVDVADPAHGFLVLVSPSVNQDAPNLIPDIMRFLNVLPSHLGAPGVELTPTDELFSVPRLESGFPALRGGPPVVVRRMAPHFTAPVPEDILHLVASMASHAAEALASDLESVHVQFHMEGAPQEDQEDAPCDKCSSDLAAFCGDAGSLYEAMMCLKDDENELTPECKEFVAGDPSVVGQCHIDIRSQCGGVSPGEGRVHACLMAHQNTLSPSCAAYVKANMASTAVPVGEPRLAGVQTAPLDEHPVEAAPLAPEPAEAVAEPVAFAKEAGAPPHGKAGLPVTTVLVYVTMAVVAVAAVVFAVVQRRAATAARSRQDAMYAALMT